MNGKQNLKPLYLDNQIIKMRKYLSTFLMVYIFIAQGCVREGSYKVTGNLPLPDGSVVTLWPDDHYHQIAGTKVNGNEFDLKIEGLRQGVYDLIVSWPDPNFVATKERNGSFITTPDSLRSNISLYLEPGKDYHLTTPVTDYTTVYGPTSQNLHPFPLLVATESTNTKDLQYFQGISEKITLAYGTKMDSINQVAKAFLAKNDPVNYGHSMREYEGLEKDFYDAQRFTATQTFISSHKASAISAYLIATTPYLKAHKAYFEWAIRQLDPSLKDNPYTKEAKRRIALN